jgi:hypothetical protein
MKRNALKTLLIFSVMAVFFTFSLPVFAHIGDEGEYQELEEQSGKVNFKRPGGYFLTTASGDEYKLMMGPIWHLENIGLELKNGENISIKGYEADEDIFLVTSVRKGENTYVLAEADEYGSFDYGHHHGMRGDMPHNRDYYGRGRSGRRSWFNRGHCW